ncbi:MAG: hypothetical protein HOL17_00475 [Gammaproteobacteria bacterium]|jgi:hypothetical protein|nr:hypothetical protein [Gammaproteobacteria bacterium]MBT4606525.1 hypothetical protein [Thiotrichales bacterium]MBT5465321.1 hypothetical protein [Candidatus Neomarinimicrobiota bacterium]MBT4329730.1 hypothetical protein [Gammaproteobacteria bacterium]MBT5370179.1 hypothetical protein [Gammaproteobacteria bacterium]
MGIIESLLVEKRIYWTLLPALFFLAWGLRVGSEISLIAATTLGVVTFIKGLFKIAYLSGRESAYRGTYLRVIVKSGVWGIKSGGHLVL